VYISMKSILKRIVIIIIVVVAIPLITCFVMNSPTAYIHKKLDFWCVLIPRRIYYYDAIGQGKDYNSLHIFSLSQFDANRLSSSLNDGNGWEILPINQEVLDSDISDANFDSMMMDMLDSQVGYWYLDDFQHDLYVLDVKNNILYIRTASIIQ